MNDELRKQLEIADAEEAFVAAKVKGRGSKEYEAAKAALDKLRTPYRQARETGVAGPGVAAPKTVTVETKG